MIVKVDFERGITPVSAIRCTGRNGSCEARTVEEAIEILNQVRTALAFRMYGVGVDREQILYGLSRHNDGWIQVVIQARNLAEACQRATDILIRKAA